MMTHIENTVKGLCEEIDKHVKEEGLTDTLASVVASTAQLAQIAAGGKGYFGSGPMKGAAVFKGEPARSTVVPYATRLRMELDLVEATIASAEQEISKGVPDPLLPRLQESLTRVKASRDRLATLVRKQEAGEPVATPSRTDLLEDSLFYWAEIAHLMMLRDADSRCDLPSDALAYIGKCSEFFATQKN